jgi:hypothetical protein
MTTLRETFAADFEEEDRLREEMLSTVVIKNTNRIPKSINKFTPKEPQPRTVLQKMLDHNFDVKRAKRKFYPRKSRYRSRY